MKNAKQNAPRPIEQKLPSNISLDELIPQPAELTLGGKTWTLRPVNLEDQIWIKEKFGDNIQAIFAEMKFEHISKIVYRLLPPEGKAHYMAKQTEGYDDDGNHIEVTLTGPQQIMRDIHGGINEQLKVVNALLHTIGISQPLIDKLAQEEIKKKEPKPRKKATTKPRTTPTGA